MATLGWYNANSLRHYPFLDGETGEEVVGTPSVANLPRSAVVDFGALLGVGSGFESDLHTVWLDRLVRIHSTLYLEFRSDAPQLHGTVLRFRRDANETELVTEFVDSDLPLELGTEVSESSLGESGSSEASCEDDPLWSGFLVTGDLTELAALLGPGDVWVGSAEVEPATCQNLAGGFISSLNLANQDRTRASGPADCLDPTWPYETGVMIVNRRCLQGALRFSEGHNASIEQDATRNLIRFGAVVGAGAGEVCEQVGLFDGEGAPDGLTTLEGALQCHEVLRSINGIGGRHFQLEAGSGVTLTPDPGLHEITLDINMSGLTICYSESSEVSDGP